MTKNDIYITNYWYAKNYGACLTAYALYKIFEELGYNPYLIDNKPLLDRCLYKNLFNKSFIKRNCNVKKISRINTGKLEQPILTTGSDQVFNPSIAMERLDDYLLNYGNINSKKIAVSASFGANKEQFIKQTATEDINKMKSALKTFDFVSVRENSGLEICKDIFNIDAKWIIDPVFIVNKKYYEEFEEFSGVNTQEKIVTYVMENKKENFKKAYKFLSNKYKSAIFSIDEFGCSLEEWVCAIKNCKLFITDSFHGMCIALIYNKPFIVVANKGNRNNRFDSIFKMLGIKNQCLSSISEIYEKNCIFEVDYKEVNKNIARQKEQALELLKNALEKPLKVTKERFDVRIEYLEKLVQKLEEQNNLNYQLKQYLQEIVLTIYYCYIPKTIKKIIRFLLHLLKRKK